MDIGQGSGVAAEEDVLLILDERTHIVRDEVVGYRIHEVVQLARHTLRNEVYNPCQNWLDKEPDQRTNDTCDGGAANRAECQRHYRKHKPREHHVEQVQQRVPEPCRGEEGVGGRDACYYVEDQTNSYANHSQYQHTHYNTHANGKNFREEEL